MLKRWGETGSELITRGCLAATVAGTSRHKLSGLLHHAQREMLTYNTDWVKKIPLIYFLVSCACDNKKKEKKKLNRNIEFSLCMSSFKWVVGCCVERVIRKNKYLSQPVQNPEIFFKIQSLWRPLSPLVITTNYSRSTTTLSTHQALATFMHSTLLKECLFPPLFVHMRFFLPQCLDVSPAHHCACHKDCDASCVASTTSTTHFCSISSPQTLSSHFSIQRSRSLFPCYTSHLHCQPQFILTHYSSLIPLHKSLFIMNTLKQAYPYPKQNLSHTSTSNNSRIFYHFIKASNARSVTFFSVWINPIEYRQVRYPHSSPLYTQQTITCHALEWIMKVGCVVFFFFWQVIGWWCHSLRYSPEDPQKSALYFISSLLRNPRTLVQKWYVHFMLPRLTYWDTSQLLLLWYVHKIIKYVLKKYQGYFKSYFSRERQSFCWISIVVKSQYNMRKFQKFHIKPMNNFGTRRHHYGIFDVRMWPLVVLIWFLGYSRQHKLVYTVNILLKVTRINRLKEVNLLSCLITSLPLINQQRVPVRKKSPHLKRRERENWMISEETIWNVDIKRKIKKSDVSLNALLNSGVS
ncbi:hypothetical protein VP01_693g1 [Puccinia sorghi]|uniref:Uncharacterized protein n=1 Tax=Puccinia sorghi TaxID=27349 RepID=A0A0L6UG89_9BASI|nr:hypothetical protein VP01_693g1 [Puccinia sorghi]